MRILSAQMLGERDCSMTVEVRGNTYELVARRIRRDPLVGGVVGDFEPSRVFRDLPLSAAQVRALTRMAVELQEGVPLLLPMDVPA